MKNTLVSFMHIHCGIQYNIREISVVMLSEDLSEKFARATGMFMSYCVYTMF